MIWDILISGGIPSRIRGGGGATNLTNISPNSRMIFHWPCHAFRPSVIFLGPHCFGPSILLGPYWQWLLSIIAVNVSIGSWSFSIFLFFFLSRMSIATIQWLLLLSIIGVTLWQCIYRLSDMPIVCQERQNIMHLLIFRTATKSKSNFNLKCIWLHFEMNISKCLKNLCITWPHAFPA